MTTAASTTLLKAILCDQTARYDDMLDCVDRLEKDDYPLNNQFRGLFATAYRKALDERRSARRKLLLIAAEKRHSQKKLALSHTEEYIKEIEGEIIKICQRGLGVCSNALAKHSAPVQRTFLAKEKADFLRYLAEVNEIYKGKAEAEYANAVEIGMALSKSDDRLKMDILLNQAVFYKEIMKNTYKAVELAENILRHEALNSLADKTVITAVVERNLSAWKSE